ncbi:MAG TPA: chemotaxis protein CheW, partial [Thermoanaerobaculia bacterium]
MSDLRLITFRVGPETFVLDIMAVRQIVQYTGSTSVPTAPSFIEGIIVLRNEVIPIVDLSDRLYPQRTGKSETPLVLITHTSAGMIG